MIILFNNNLVGNYSDKIYKYSLFYYFNKHLKHFILGKIKIGNPGWQHFVFGKCLQNLCKSLTKVWLCRVQRFGKGFGPLLIRTIHPVRLAFYLCVLCVKLKVILHFACFSNFLDQNMLKRC